MICAVPTNISALMFLCVLPGFISLVLGFVCVRGVLSNTVLLGLSRSVFFSFFCFKNACVFPRLEKLS